MSNTGQNTSASRQAVITIASSGCLTPALAETLQKSMVIELPDTPSADGRIDVLSSSALDQIAAQLSASAAFQTLLQSTISESATQDAIVAALVADPDFQALVDGSALKDKDKPVLGGTTTASLDASKNMSVPIEASGMHAFVYSVVAPGAINSTGSYVASSSTNTAIINFPNATAGDAITVNWVRYLTS